MLYSATRAFHSPGIARVHVAASIIVRCRAARADGEALADLGYGKQSLALKCTYVINCELPHRYHLSATYGIDRESPGEILCQLILEPPVRVHISTIIRIGLIQLCTADHFRNNPSLV